MQKDSPHAVWSVHAHIIEILEAIHIVCNFHEMFLSFKTFELLVELCDVNID